MGYCEINNRKNEYNIESALNNFFGEKEILHKIVANIDQKNVAHQKYIQN